MKTKALAWFIIVMMAVGIFFATQFSLNILRNWALDTTHALETAQTERMKAIR